MTKPRPSLRLVALVAFVLVSLIGIPAAAGGTSSDKSDAVLERFEIDIDPDLTATIKLHCRGHVADGPVVGCSWRAPDDAGIVSFQLWNLQIAPTEGVRNLVAELGADAASYIDGAVEAPGAYLYVALGLDADGEIVARSRVDRARLGDPGIERLRLTCEGSTGDAPAVTCGWGAAEESAVASYVLYRGTKGDERIAVATLGADNISFTDTSIECGVRYRYRIVGLDADGDVVAKSRRDAAGCGERDHERDHERDGVKERDHRTKRGHTDSATESDIDTGTEGDTIVAAERAEDVVSEPHRDEQQPTDHRERGDRRSDQAEERRERGR